MKKVILKFGGTSLTTNKKRARIIDLVKSVLKDGYIPIVVVSAIGRFTDPYATDTLISLVDNTKFEDENKQTMDLLMSCGESISAAVMASCFKEHNINAMPLTGGQAGIITDSNFGDATIIRFDDKIINKVINKGIIPIVCGFQGVDEDGFITTLGRGGSDSTATILGANLDAEKIYIYKDVDGIMTSDPNEDENAHILNKLTYNEAFEIANSGAKVIHAKAISYAKDKNIPIIVKNLFGNKDGTLITK